MIVIIMLPLPDDCYIISVAELNLRQISCPPYIIITHFLLIVSCRSLPFDCYVNPVQDEDASKERPM